MTWQLYQGDALKIIKDLVSESIHCCVTSPPYWGLRDYGVEGQLGLEPTPEEYVSKVVEVFREVKRVLRKDGTLWLNLGDSYAKEGLSGMGDPTIGERNLGGMEPIKKKIPQGLKPKDLVGIPWRVAFALQSDGWYLRSDIIWSKPNPMPESVIDRPSKSHEYIFLLSKSNRYYYDYKSIKEPVTESSIKRLAQTTLADQRGSSRVPCKTNGNMKAVGGIEYRNKRTVWNIPTSRFSEAHFATFPTELVKPCILAGCPVGGTALDPYAGSGTTLFVAEQLERNSVGIELKPEYCSLINRRMAGIETNLFQMQ
ncbi:site-specific DNA-methyltransferase [Bacteroides sp.]|uniref:DNA-methyltransferase n=1 Tax=Bacteroides sp. TaxID=29523 RepID=UPI0026041725|nr:site-specific DNA-methyltransferase [Bacteroides sp.]MDD3040436.1 site-specific DNA-methyltransferase [Bacteroides sp.]